MSQLWTTQSSWASDGDGYGVSKIIGPSWGTVSTFMTNITITS